MKQIIYSELKAHIDAGMKKKELAELYELPESQMTKVLQQAGLQIRRFHAPKFELVMDVPVEGETTEGSTEGGIVVEDVNDTPTMEYSDTTADAYEEADEFVEEESQSSQGGW